MQDILEVLEETSIAKLRTSFTKPEVGKPRGLILIPDIAERLDREVGRTSEGLLVQGAGVATRLGSELVPKLPRPD